MTSSYATTIFLSCFLMISPGCGPDPTDAVKLLEEAKRELAPDRRTAVFDIEPSVERGLLVLRGEIQSASLRDRLVSYLTAKSQYQITDSLVVLPLASLDGRVYGVVSVSVANIRTKAGHTQEMATQVLLGMPLRILKKNGGWLYVQTPEEYLGWTDDEIAIFNREEYSAWIDKEKIIVVAPFGFVTNAPGPEAGVVSDFVAGDVFALKGVKGNHFVVEYPDGRTGYLAQESAKPFSHWIDDAKDTPESIVATAKRFMGIPYLWGGTSVKGMDCSGYTKMVYYLNGVLLPRDASQQELVGDSVSVGDGYANLQTGDLLFFGARETPGRKRRVTHVGIYLDDKKFIHESGDVRINSFDPADPLYSEYRTKSLLSARRIIGCGPGKGVKRFAATPFYQRDL